VTCQTKKKGLRVWNDGLFQSWFILRIQSFPPYLTYELMEGKLMVKKWNMQGRRSFQSFKLTIHHHLQGHHNFNQQGSLNFQRRQTLDLK
jgi:hypothetical protein